MRYAFATWILDTQLFTLERAGHTCQLPPKLFQMLQYLLDHRDKVVSKHELVEHVWAGQFISDASPERAISALRHLLGDSGQDQRILKTIRGHGYRVVVPVSVYVDTAPHVPASPITPCDGLGESVAPPLVVAPLGAERRHLTVLCGMVVDATALASRLDAEAYHAVMRVYHQICTEVVQRFDGTIAHYQSDGVLVYFGAPLAHEDDAHRAVRAGLALLEALTAWPTNPAVSLGELVAARLGVHTGLAVVDDGGGGTHSAPLALGTTPQIAIGLSHLAAPNTLLISAATQQLVAGSVRCKPLGTPPLPGLHQRLEVYQVLGASEAPHRLAAVAQHGLTPLVGRTQEVALLLERWELVTDGLGQVVLLTGEAGIGKSRLAQVLIEHVAETGHRWLACQGSPYYHQTAFAPLIELLERAVLHWDPKTPPVQKLRTLETLVRQYALPPVEGFVLLATLLALPLPPDTAPLALSPEQQKQRTLHILLTLLVRLAAEQPLLLVLEDLHWVDPSTLEWLRLLVDHGPITRLLTLCTTRPDVQPPWTGRAHCTPLTLARLPERQATALTRQVARGATLSAEVVAQIVAQTDGVPLFVEEVTKTVLASDRLWAHATPAGPPPPLAIPATLAEALLARLDRLGAAKGLAQLGATLGREFPYALLQAVAPWDEATVRQGLQHLVDAELLYQRGLPPEATYVFKHALLQDAAYQSLLTPIRQQYHQHIAQVLEAQGGESTATRPEVLAQHYTAAGLPVQALPYWQAAGERAVQRSAHLEAISHFTRGLDLVLTLPETAQRSQQELGLHLAVGPSLIATQGYSAPRVEQTYRRALTLCQHLGDTPELLPALGGLAIFYLVRGALSTAHHLSARVVQLAQKAQDPLLSAEASVGQGVLAYYLGDFPAAHVYCTQGLALYTRAPHHSRAFPYQDPQVAGLVHMALTLEALGYPDQATLRLTEAVATAQRLAHPYTLVWTLAFAARFHQHRREAGLTQEQAEATILGAVEHGFAYSRANGMLLRGWAVATHGCLDEGLAQMQQGLATVRALGTRLALPYWLGLLAEGYGHAGRPTEGQALLEEALAVVDETGQRYHAAELLRLQGELHLHDPSPQVPQAEVCLRQALAIARQQQARAFELRAALRLARLWQQQGKRAEAAALLAPVYYWFTEGFETADLQEARALLEELGR